MSTVQFVVLISYFNGPQISMDAYNFQKSKIIFTFFFFLGQYKFACENSEPYIKSVWENCIHRRERGYRTVSLKIQQSSLLLYNYCQHNFFIAACGFSLKTSNVYKIYWDREQTPSITSSQLARLYRMREKAVRISGQL